MKLKQQASGWPTECDTEEKKRNYLHEYQTQQDIQLDPNQIEKNLAYVPWPNSCLTLSGANLANAPIRHKYPAVQDQVNFFRSSQMIDK